MSDSPATVSPRVASLTRQVKGLSKAAGFHLVGVTSAEDFPETEEVIAERVRAGLLDGLPWYNEARARRGCRPKELLPGARSIISLGLSYAVAPPGHPADGLLRGRIARYAWGRDYHKVIERRVKAFTKQLAELGAMESRFYVDYGPMPDRAVAQRAGLGWFGKNTNLLTSGLGSWVFLAEVITDLPLTPDRPLKKNCGKCIACIPACPTNAIIAPYVVDNRRCISYHTIENRGVIPRGMRPLMGDWVFGCDICQDVCPVNSRSRGEGDSEFAPKDADSAWPDLIEMLSLTEADFERRFRGSAVRRAKLSGLQRNVCIALGNLRDARAVPALVQALSHREALVRGHAAWALGRIGGRESRRALKEAAAREGEAWVREEIALAMGTSA